MIYLVLDYLCSESCIFTMLWFEVLIQIINLDLFISRARSDSVKRKTTLFRLIFPAPFRDDRIYHREDKRSGSHYNEVFLRSTCFLVATTIT